MELSFKVTGLESLDKEFDQLRDTLNLQLTTALRSMEDPLKQDLKTNIEYMVYKAYTPKVYPRRSDNPGKFGTPLNDMEETTNFGLLPTGAGIFFRYLPKGYHSGTLADLEPGSKYYNGDDNIPIKKKPVHDDDLIRRIETGKGYDWKCRPGKRPFWKHFVDNEISEGFSEHFLIAMKEAGVTDIVGGFDVVREEGDGEY